MDIITAILIAAIVAGLSPIAQQLTNSVVQDIRRRRAFARLQSERLIAVGTCLGSIRDASGGAPLFGLCEVVDLRVGRVVVRNFGPDGTIGGCKMAWTGQEFEKLHPLVLVDPKTGIPLHRDEVAVLNEKNAAAAQVIQFPTGGTPSVH